MVAVSGLATLLFVASFLVNGIESPLTWATIAVWAVADTALVATMVGDTQAKRRSTSSVAKARPPAERRAAAELLENINALAAERLANTPAGATVVLVHTGRNKIAVIKALREALHTGLKEAKDLADAADRSPAVVATGLGRAEAERLLRELHAAGARAEIR
jgi:ribosomal protein L7/L12